jgi:two-component system, NarL family, response regulator NreC
MKTLRILLVDDHAVVREGLKRLIEAQTDMRVVGEAADGREAIDKAVQLAPEIVVVDVSMGEMNGAETTRQLRQRCPATMVLALTVHEDCSYLRELLDAGAMGYVVKRAAGDELIRAIRAVATGTIYVDPRMAEKLLRTLAEPAKPPSHLVSDLSERESVVMRLIALGYTNKEIAGQLNVSVKTIETYKARSMEKLKLHSRVDIVRIAAERGWLPQT